MEDLYKMAREIKTITDEATAAGIIVCPAVLVDICDDLAAGILLSQILYWFQPSESGKLRATVTKGGYIWIAKKRGDWYGEIRLTVAQIDRAMERLKKLNFVIRADTDYKFAGVPTPHYRPDYDALLQALASHHNNTLTSTKSDITQSEMSTSHNVLGQPDQHDGIINVELTESGRSDLIERVMSYTEPTYTEPFSKLSPREGKCEGERLEYAASLHVAQTNDAAPTSLKKRCAPIVNYTDKNAQLLQHAISVRGYRRKRKGQMPDADRIEFALYFLARYEEHLGVRHPQLPVDSWQDKLATMCAYPQHMGKWRSPLDVDDLPALKSAVDEYFATEYNTKKGKPCKRHISHFLSYGVLSELYNRSI